MSRIHQALSKAAQERANQNKAATSADIMEITAQISSIASLEEKLEFVVPESAGPAVEDSAVQGLQTSFVNSGWELHPQFNTFSPGVKEKVGAERFRTLRSRLYQVAETKSLRRIMVTSSVPSEGKSFVCANLALAMAQQQNRRVLLIDADLRLPTLHKMLSVPRSPGLSNYLRGELDEHLAIQEGKQDNLFCMSAGDEAANPSELLMGDAMKRFMRFAAESFEW